MLMIRHLRIRRVISEQRNRSRLVWLIKFPRSVLQPFVSSDLGALADGQVDGGEVVHAPKVLQSFVSDDL